MLHHSYPPRPQPPRPAQGFLMQKIIACERRSISCLHTDLCLNDCAVSAIRSVRAGGAALSWSFTDGCTLRLTIPLIVSACDACGCPRTLSSSIDVETTLPGSFLCAMEDPRLTLVILPCVRLLRSDCGINGCFGVQLAVSMEIFLLRYTTLCPDKPSCPSLPLYPQPPC